MALPRARAWLVAIVATAAMSVSYIDRQVVAVIATSVRAALGFDAERFGWLAGAFSAAYLVAAPVAGAVLDRVGARRGLVVAILAWSAVSAAHALAPSLAALLALRVALGVAEAPSFPGAAQSVRRALPPRDRSAAFGLIFTGSSLGAAVAGPLAIALDVRFGWRAAFAITSLLGCAWVPLWIAVTRAPEVRAALAAPAPAPVQARAAPGAAASLPALLKEAAVLRALVMVLASAPALMFLFVWMPQYMEIGRGVAKADLGRYVWLPPVMADVGMVGFGALAARWPPVRLVLAAAAMATVMVLVPAAPGPWGAIALMGVSAMGAGGIYTLLTADMMARVDPARAAAAGGLTAAAQSVVYVALNPIVGRWVLRTSSFDGALMFVGALALPGACIWSLWPMRRERDSQT
jgi:ACS family hexuronate transporter-like MFS transporter